MNYQKKRNRLSGRQSRQPQDIYQVYVDNEGKVNGRAVKARRSKLIT